MKTYKIILTSYIDAENKDNAHDLLEEIMRNESLKLSDFDIEIKEDE